MLTINNLSNSGYSVNNLPEYWRKIVYAAVKKVGRIERPLDDYFETVKSLVREYQSQKYIRSRILVEMLELPDIVIVLFYVFLYNHLNLKKDESLQIAKMKHDTKWMVESDFCFLNIRALGKETAETGNIIDAMKLIPSLRVSGIHLAPFFECNYGIIYCQDSFYRINHEIVNLYYARENITPIEQMKFLVDCIHVLHKSVGFDVTPHTSWISKLRIDRPELFRWVRLNNNKDGLYDDMSIDSQYEEKYQQLFEEGIQSIANKIKEEYAIQKLDDVDNDFELSKEIAEKVNKAIQDEGYYTVPPHTWNGLCVPDFKKFAENLNMPIWCYLDANGQDQGQHAIWLHSSLYIHKGMYANQLPAQVSGDTKKNKVERNEEVMQFFKEYLEEVIERYCFDFVRMDYVDHIFDNVTYVNGEEIPLNEMFTPMEIKDMITDLRKEYPGLGLQADHLGYDAKLFETAGFNLITGGEVGFSMNHWHVNTIFENLLKQDELQGDTCRSTFAIDTHDMAHPLFFGKEIAHREGRVGIIARLFISRFGNTGQYRRPKYEVIGNQDLSHGIHRANNKAESLVWSSSQVVYNAYHDIEDIYMKLKDDLLESSMREYCVSDKHIGWTIYNKDKNKGWIAIIPIVLRDGLICDSDLLKQQESKKRGDTIQFNWDLTANGKRGDHFSRNFKNGQGPFSLDCQICSSIENLQFDEAKSIIDDVLYSISFKDNQLKIEMKTCGFLLFEVSGS